MSQGSRIEWTQATWNPVTGCDRISLGCEGCYAAAMARRLQAMGNPKYQCDGDPRTSGPGFGVQVHPQALDLPRTWKRPRTVFVNSMSDLFHARVPEEFIRGVFAVMADTPRHTFQLLTKRSRRLRRVAGHLEWPPNVWMGVSVENADHVGRVDDLREVPAAVRFVSAEPLLGPLPGLDLAGIGWVITGGESGPRARPIDPDWVRDIRDACARSHVAFFHKHWGGRNPRTGGRTLDGRTHDDMPPGTGRTPRRVQRTRTRGGGIPAGAIYVGRPGRWGNPYRVGDPGIPDRATAVARYADLLAADHALTAVARRTLAGRDLACWCPPGAPCHADILLTAANTTGKDNDR